jgi:chemotaxis protein histidine kinase CheA
MLPEDQKRILGYFIEEAKDHLNTIEQGLLNLQTTIEDGEMVNEVFRAAHSVKGGAAMLGLNSIQLTSHRLEDFFKLMKESPIQADRDLETMLLQIFDGLQEQLEQLQGPYGLADEQAEAILATLEPVFSQAEAHLRTLVAAAPAVSPVPSAPAGVPTAVSVSHPETSALQLVFQSDVPAMLREMLALFKRTDQDLARQELVKVCQRLNRIGEQFELNPWCELIGQATLAIANSQQTFRTLAPILIKDLKRAQDLVLAGNHYQISATAELLALLPPSPALKEDEESALEALLEDEFDQATTAGAAELAELFAAGASDEATAEALPEPDLSWLTPVVQPDLSDVEDLEAAFDSLTAEGPGMNPASGADRAINVEVGAAELNSLADLFEDDLVGLESAWEEEEFADTGLDGDTSDGTEPDLESDLADLLQAAEPADRTVTSATVDDDLESLFDQALDAALPSSPETTSIPELDDLELDDDDFASGLASAPSGFPDTAVDQGGADGAGSGAGMPEAGGDSNALDDFFAVDTVDTVATNAAGLADTPQDPQGIDEDIDDFFDSQLKESDRLFPPEARADLDLAGDIWQDTPTVSPDPTVAVPEPTLFDPFLEAPEPPRAPAQAADFDALFDMAASQETDGGTVTAFTAESGHTDNPEALEWESELDPLDQSEGPQTAAIDLDDSADEGGFLADQRDSETVHEALPVALNEGQFNAAADGGDAWDILQPPLNSPEADPDLLSDDGPDNSSEDSFEGLDSLLGNGDDPVQDPDTPFPDLDVGSAPVQGDEDDFDEFSDLERLLEDTDQLGGPSPTLGSRRTGATPATRRAPRRTATITDQTMRVSVSHLDILSNLVGELVVNRNSLEQDQERLRQFLDNLLLQVQQLNDVGQRMRDLYERSLLESSLISSRQPCRQAFPVNGGGNSHATGATFDALEMDRFTGFHTLSQEMIELIVGSGGIFRH